MELLKDTYHCDKIIFSIVSTENIGTVKNYASEILKYSDSILLGKQFYEEGYIDYENNTINNQVLDKTKLGQMVNYIKEVSKKENLSLICYADDNANEIFASLFRKICPDSQIKIMVPSKKIDSPNIISSGKPAIYGLYACLDKAILDHCDEININNEKKK